MCVVFPDTPRYHLFQCPFIPVLWGCAYEPRLLSHCASINSRRLGKHTILQPVNTPPTLASTSILPDFHLTMSLPPSYYILPDLFSLSTAFHDATNPFWKRASAESRRWVNSYAVFADRRRAFFFQGQSELLSSHCYPYAGYEEFRTCCDLINLLFVIDELSDEQDYGDARQTGDIFLHVMQDPTWSDGSKLARMTAE